MRLGVLSVWAFVWSGCAPEVAVDRAGEARAKVTAPEDCEAASSCNECLGLEGCAYCASYGTCRFDSTRDLQGCMRVKRSVEECGPAPRVQELEAPGLEGCNAFRAQCEGGGGQYEQFEDGCACACGGMRFDVQHTNVRCEGGWTVARIQGEDWYSFPSYDCYYRYNGYRMSGETPLMRCFCENGVELRRPGDRCEQRSPPEGTPPPIDLPTSGDPRCSDSCQYSRDGECDDGRPGASYSVCRSGTDCTDCGPVSATAAPTTPRTAGGGCDDSCRYARDGECDDGRPGAVTSACSPGTDCTDCGG